MFSFFKRRSNSQNQFNLFDSEKIESKLNSIQLLYTKPAIGFYDELIEYFNLDFIDAKNPLHQKFKDDFKQNIKELSPDYGEVIASAFKNETVDNFISKLEDVLNKEFDVKFVLSVTVIFWFQITLNIKNEIHSRNNSEITTKYESFINRLKKTSENVKLN
jgi:hypothetical protein